MAVLLAPGVHGRGTARRGGRRESAACRNPARREAGAGGNRGPRRSARRPLHPPLDQALGGTRRIRRTALRVSRVALRSGRAVPGDSLDARPLDPRRLQGRRPRRGHRIRPGLGPARFLPRYPNPRLSRVRRCRISLRGGRALHVADIGGAAAGELRRPRTLSLRARRLARRPAPDARSHRQGRSAQPGAALPVRAVAGDAASRCRPHGAHRLSPLGALYRQSRVLPSPTASAVSSGCPPPRSSPACAAASGSPAVLRIGTDQTNRTSTSRLWC